MPTKKTAADPKARIQERTAEILGLTGAFCREHLDEEYAALCERLVVKMSRKRAVPYLAGKTEIWAGAVVYALGQVNFLFDRSGKPHTTPGAIAEHFSTTTSSLGQKAKAVRDMFKMRRWDAEFSTEEMAARNPFASMLIIGGLIVPKALLPGLARLSGRRKG